MDSDVKISVIIPAYNSQATIIQAINSIISQTIPFFEIIIVNDGSSDNTESLVRKFINENPSLNIKIINQNNSGPSAARNNGINSAIGNWIAFLDADDRWIPEKLEKQLLICKMNPKCSIIGTSKYQSNKTYKNEFDFVSFNSMLFSNHFLTSSVLIKKEIIKKFFFDEKMKYSEDYKLWLQVIRLNQGIILHDKLIIYGDNENKLPCNNLSKNYWKMEKGELSNLQFLYNQKMINIWMLLIASTYSFLKFLRRLVLS